MHIEYGFFFLQFNSIPFDLMQINKNLGHDLILESKLNLAVANNPLVVFWRHISTHLYVYEL